MPKYAITSFVQQMACVFPILMISAHLLESGKKDGLATPKLKSG